MDPCLANRHGPQGLCFQNEKKKYRGKMVWAETLGTKEAPKMESMWNTSSKLGKLFVKKPLFNRILVSLSVTDC